MFMAAKIMIWLFIIIIIIIIIPRDTPTHFVKSFDTEYSHLSTTET